jgi:molecular chaperone GrpE
MSDIENQQDVEIPQNNQNLDSEQTETQNQENAAEALSEKEPPPQTDQEKIEALELKVAELNDLYLRKAADFENFRKRTTKEKQDAIDFANQSLLLDLIPVLDDFERARKAAEASEKTDADFNNLCEGVSMIEKRLQSQLENKWALKRYESEGQPFDPVRHEALMMEKSADVSEVTVKEEFVKGYTLRDRVIRAAKVKVITPE